MHKCHENLSRWPLACRLFLAQCERYFEAHGRLIGQNPRRSILVSLLLVALLGLGLLNLRIETETEKLFVPTNTEAESALQSSKPYFVNLLNSREQAIIFQRKPGYNLLSKECVREAKLIVSAFIDNGKYQELCVNRARYINASIFYDLLQPCFLVNPYEVIVNDTTAAEDMVAALKNNYTLMSNGRTMLDNKMSMFPVDFPAVSINNVAGLRVVLYLKEYTTDNEKKEALEWEKSYIDKLEKEKKSAKCFSVTFTARRSLDDAILDSSSSDVGIVSIAFALMNIFTSNSLGKFSNSIRGHSLLAMSGIYTTALGILAGFGITILIGTPFTSVVGLLPFLILSVGIDDMFIIIDEIDTLPLYMSPERRVGSALAKVGASITMTTLTDIVGFAVSASSAFPVIQYFCIFATITFTTEFCLQMILFLALLTYDAKRINASRRDCLPFCRGQDRQRCSKVPRTPISKVVMKKYATFLVSVQGKAFVLFTSMGMLVLGLYGCLHVGESFDRRTLIKDGKYLTHYLDNFEKFFPQTIEVNLVQNEKVDYSNKQIQTEILRAPKLAIATGFYKAEYRSWLEDFLKWSEESSIDIDGEMFKKALGIFLENPRFASFKRDVRFDSRGDIVASQTQIFMKQTTSSIFQRDAMIKLREAFKENKITLIPTSDPFIYFEQYAAVTKEVVRNICITAAIILCITAPFCMYFSISLLLLLGFVTLLINLVGLMYFWNVTINAVSMINLVMSFGFTVDYSAHIAYAFVTSGEEKADRKVVDAMSSVGASVFFGGFSTFLGMITLGLASTEIFQIFFKMFVGIVILGLFNGLALLPVLFALFGDFFLFKRTDFAFAFKSKSTKKRGGGGFSNVKMKTLKAKPYVSVVGIAARFPTARNKDEFWKLLTEGRNTLSDYPSYRKLQRKRFKDMYHPFRTVRGRLYVTAGSYMEDIDKFDNNFFGISHSEAKMMDPQQRILLQGVFEAIEDAGLTLQELQAVNTGVYVGSMNLDYTSLIGDVGNTEINQFTGTGTSSAIIANRISFSLNLQGPSMTIDTACSSSLTALNIAYEHLKNGKCDIAIVASSNVILDQNKQTIISQAKMLALDGQSKVFDVRRDGYGRGEGMVVVILRPRSHMLSDDHSIYSNILACNVNNDGQSAIPMTAPSVDGQGRLFKITCMEAGISPNQVSYVEAHGTGTVIGDLVETQSISDGYCLHRDASSPLRIGSVKSNVNHTESVAGLAGLAKVCLMIKNKKFLPTVGIEEINEELNLGTKALVVQQNVEDWKVEVSGNSRCAAINSFGFGGSNAHVVVEEPHFDKSSSPREANNVVVQPDYKVIVISARSKVALREQADGFSKWLSEQTDDPKHIKDICYSLCERRTAHSYRGCVVFKEREEAVDSLKVLATDEIAGEFKHRLSFDRVKYNLPKVAFVFGGQGSECDKMIDLLSEHDELKRIFDLVDKELSTVSVAASLLEDIKVTESNAISFPDVDIQSRKNNARSALSDLTILQLSIFKVQYAISTMLMNRCDIVPTVVLGHSLGDIIAACISGCISLRNAIEIIIIRAELQNACKKDGKMAALEMSADEARAMLEESDLEGKVDIAAINDHDHVTISGDSEAVEKAEAFVCNKERGISWRNLNVAKAYHSHHMDSIKPLFWKHIKKVKFKSRWTTVQFISSVYAKCMKAEELNIAYWWDNIREPVNFAGAMEAIRDLGCQIIVELSPKPVLKSYLLNMCKSFSMESRGVEYEVLTAFPRPKEEKKIEFLFSNCVGQMFNVGLNVNFSKLLNLSEADFVRYPPYAWQETSCWLSEKIEESSQKTLLGNLVNNDHNGKCVYESEIDTQAFQCLWDHKLVDIGPAFPGAAYVEMALEAVLMGRKLQSVEIRDQSFDNLLTLPYNDIQLLRTTVHNLENSNEFKISIDKIIEDGELMLATSKVKTFLPENKGLTLAELVSTENPQCTTKLPFELRHLQQTASEHFNKEEMYRMVQDAGVQCEESFSLLAEAWKSHEKLLVKFTLPTSVYEDLPRFVIHPAIIDAAFQSVVVAINNKGLNSVVPIGVGKLEIFPVSKKTSQLYCLVKYDKENLKSTSIQMLSMEGETLMLIKDVKVVNLSKVPPRLSLAASAFKWKYIAGPLEDVMASESEHFKWIILGLKNHQTHREFFNYLEREYADVTFVEVENLEKSSSLVEDLQRKLFIASDERRCNILANFIPAEIHSIVTGLESLAASQKMLFHCCFGILGNIFKGTKFNYRLVLVTSDDINHRYDDSSIYGSCSNNLPISSSVWGFARSVRLEVPMQKILCADITQCASDLNFGNLFKYCVGKSNEPDIVIREKECFFPRLCSIENDHNNTMFSLPASQLQSYPHYLTMTSKGDFRILKANRPNLIEEKCVKVQVEFASPCLGGAEIFATTDAQGKASLDEIVLCYGGTIIPPEQNLETPQHRSNIITFARSQRIQNQLQVKSSMVSIIPSELSLKESAAISGPLSVASKLIKHIAKTCPATQNCLVSLHDQTEAFSFMVMIVAKARNWDVYTTDVNYDDHMTSLGIGFVNIQDLFHVADSHVNQSLIFDCIISTNNLEENKVEILAAAIKPGGCYIAVDDGGHKLKKPKRYAISVENRTVSCDLFICSQISEEELLEEWLKLCPLLRQKQCIWAEALKRNIKVVDPYGSRCNKENFKGMSLNTVQLNSSSEGSVKVESCLLDDFGLYKDGTYIVVGGHKGFGLESTIWLSELGACYIVTCGRSGLSDEAYTRLSSIALKRTFHFKHVICDVTASEGINTLKAALSKFPVLRGIINSASVYEDKLFEDVNYNNFERVLGPKVTGTIRLNKMVDSLGVNLDFFVLYSSIVSALGNIGQASYTAANFFMNEFANRMKRLTGQNFLSVCWGPMSGAGFLAENKDIADRITDHMGLHMIPIKTGLQWLESILKNHSKLSTVFLTSFDWKKLHGTPLSDLLVLEDLISANALSDANMQSIAHLEAIKMCRTDEEKWTALQMYMREWLSSWLGTTDESEVDLNASLSNFGLDSVKTVEFQTKLFKDFSVNIPMLTIRKPDTTGNTLVSLILDKITSQPTSDDDQKMSPDGEMQSTSRDCLQSSSGGRTGDGVNELHFDSSFIGLAYSPPNPLANFFWVHSAHRYRGSMLQKAEGFKCQDVFQVYAIGSEDTTYKGNDREDIRPLAIAYVNLIMKIQPRGPYFIGGYSFGGCVAYEIASVLTEMKEVVALLVMLDTNPWISKSTANAKFLFSCIDASNFLDIKVILSWHVKSVAVHKLGMDEQEFDRLYSENSLEDVVTEVERFAESNSLDTIDLRKLVEAMSHNLSISSEAMKRWEPAKVTYNGPVLFVEATDRSYMQRFPGFGRNSACWKRIIKPEQLYVHLVEGNHYTIFRKRSTYLMYGRIFSTMARMILRQKFPYLYGNEALPFNTLSIQVLRQGINATLGRGQKGTAGVLKANLEKRRLKFKSNREASLMKKKIIFPFSDIVNIIKASESVKAAKDTSAMGILIWMHEKEFPIYFEFWLDYLKVVHGLQAAFHMKLPLL